MKTHYISYGDLSEEGQKSARAVLQRIKGALEMRDPKTRVGISLRPEDYWKEYKDMTLADLHNVLREFERKGIFKLPKKLDDSKIVTVSVNKKKFASVWNKAFKKSGPSEPVTEIICVRPEKGETQFDVIINDNYKKPIRGSSEKSWGLLLKVAEGKEPVPTNRECRDYFNSNKGNKIYAQGGYKVTKILKTEYGEIKPNVKMNVISRKAFGTRINKMRSD
jgi:hypothetical protein